MAESASTTPEVRANMESKNIDVALSLEILDRFNRGEFDHFQPVRVKEIPEVDGRTVVDFTGEVSLTVPSRDAHDRLAGLLPGRAPQMIGREIGREDGSEIFFSHRDLETMGLLMMPRVAYGVLNGGSATSYADRTKNAAFSAELVDLFGDRFDDLAELSRGRAKGLTPAFVQPDGTFGPSFLQLKMRGLLALAIRSRALLDECCPESANELPPPVLPFFEMTSIHTHEELHNSYPEYRNDPVLADLIALTGLDPTDTVGRVQPLIAAFTHSSAGRPKQIFTRAYGRENETLPLPGGHGQNFAVLAEVYRSLRVTGKRFVYIGNVDNLGYLPDAREIAYLALTGAQAGFDFALRTPVDVKGGILVRDQHGRLSCADIGPAISRDNVAAAEAEGKPILFNAATGLFDLDYLVPNLERIARELPTRITDQSKDAGEYSQAEQVTWEVISMLDDFLAFSVRKSDRFLAAKLLTETLMTSGLKLESNRYPRSSEPEHDLRGAAIRLNKGLVQKLSGDYGMTMRGDRWQPIPAEELRARLTRV